MKRKAKQGAPDWMAQLLQLCSRCEAVSRLWLELDRQFHEGGDIEPRLTRIGEEMGQITKEADGLHETMCVAPIRKMLSRDRLRLTEREYHLLRASGVELFTAEGLGVAPISDHEAYKLSVYEDDRHVAFMDPNETPDTVTTINKKTGRERVRLRLALSPEECAIRNLRPEQRSFYTKHRPDVLARMQSGDASAARRTGRGRRGRIQEQREVR